MRTVTTANLAVRSRRSLRPIGRSPFRRFRPCKHRWPTRPAHGGRCLHCIPREKETGGQPKLWHLALSRSLLLGIWAGFHASTPSYTAQQLGWTRQASDASDAKEGGRERARETSRQRRRRLPSRGRVEEERCRGITMRVNPPDQP